ncbi:hypothetical protein GCM10011297_35020 [Bacterioplanes sanyensis]|uniref:hypothetical protein n=1 Tax=Bacterioplanes sanyensis TaxID=1249553 RepID=UPI00167A79FE|nr:hypothetical protein [Bacterioplanes sanyensis]GGY59500.1 hypothetical protein GCM10011297_35020 [Bacterioplanes sanyensis]
MNLRVILCLAVALPAFVFAADPTIDNSAGRSVGSTKEERLERLKELKLQQSKSKVEAETREKLKALDLSKSEVSSYAVSSEVPLSTLLIPLIREAEQKEVSTDWSKMQFVQQNNFGRMLEACQLFSDVMPVPTAFPLHMPPRTSIRPGHGEGWLLVQDGPTHAFFSDPSLGYVKPVFSIDAHGLSEISDMKSLSYAVGRKVDSAAVPVRCYYFYARLGEAVINELTRFSVAADGEPTRKQNLFVGGDLQQVVRDAFTSARYGPNRYEPYPDVEEFAQPEISKGCRLPTLLGIQSNAVDWQCGGLMVDPNTSTASLGGMQILGGNTFFGKSVTLTQVDTFELAKAMLSSERQQIAQSESTEQSKSTALTKGKASTTATGSTTEIGAGAGVGSKGGN